MSEQSRQGWANTKLFSEIVSHFGWTQCGPLDRDVEFEVRLNNGKIKKEKIGVDALFRFDCPYTETKRVILVDGKRYAMSSMSSSTLTGFVRDVVTSTDRLRHASGALQRDRGISRDHIVDTAVIAWDCHDGWDRTKGRKIISQIDISQRKSPPVLALVLTTDHLDALQTLRQLAGDTHRVEFFYRNGRPASAYSNVLAPEMLLSSVIPMRLSSLFDAGKPEKTGFFVPDVDAFSKADFPMELAALLGLLHPRVLTAWICGSRLLFADTKEAVANALTKLKLNSEALNLPELEAIHVPKTPFDS